MSQFVIKKATKYQAKGRIGFVGPAGSGETYTSLIFATSLGEKICLIGSENLSSEKHADKFDFDVLPLDPPYSPERYTQAIKFADEQGYDVIVIDSLSHAWAGEGGALEMVDNNKARYKSSAVSAPGLAVGWAACCCRADSSCSRRKVLAPSRIWCIASVVI